MTLLALPTLSNYATDTLHELQYNLLAINQAHTAANRAPKLLLPNEAYKATSDYDNHSLFGRLKKRVKPWIGAVKGYATREESTNAANSEDLRLWNSSEWAEERLG